MQNILQPLSPADISALGTFLCSPNRPDGTLSFHELQGFLFAIACSPETIPPSEWLPIISNDEDMGFENEVEAHRILNHVMTLYNEVNGTVLERSNALPSGCGFNDDVVANFDEQTSISQWSRGFATGHDWLAEVWDEYLPEELDEECGANLMVLSFFGSRQLAEAYFAEANPAKRKKRETSFDDFAETVRELFPSALSAYAHLGRTIFEVLSKDGDADNKPAKSEKVGRNDPCPCGSGKKYKKCCGSQLH